MTGQADFTAEEWQAVLEGPPSAGLMVAASQKGGTFRESLSIGKAYIEARKKHGESQLLDEVVGSKPQLAHTHYHSLEDLKTAALQKLRDAVALLDRKASPDEVEDYRQFVLDVAGKVAEAHREGFLGMSGERVSDAERQAVQEVGEALGTTAPASG